MFDLTTFVGFNTWLSLITLEAGMVVVIDRIRARKLPGWTALFLVTAVATSASLYLLVVVGVVQAFQKIAFLNRLAPTQSELPFLLAQVGALLSFVSLGIVAARNYRPGIAAARP